MTPTFIPVQFWLAACVALGAGWWNTHQLYEHAQKNLQAVEKAALRADIKARAAEVQAAQTLDHKNQQLKEASHAAQLRTQDILARHRAGTQRLSVPGTGCSAAGANAAAAQPDQQARTELDGPTAQTLVSIAADGDTAISKLNACIDSYNAVRSAINTPADSHVITLPAPAN